MAQESAGLKVNGKTIALSNLEKVLYPPAGFQKAHVIDYYIRISHVLLPHLKDRPLTMKRYPDGVLSEHFYEKNAPSHTPEWVRTAMIASGSQEKLIRYILLNDLPSLVWSANLANLELHTLLGRAPNVHVPTMMVFDLDPGLPAGILECAQVALWLKEILDALRLESFPKSSGSKGIQLYVPINTRIDYLTTRAFAEAIAKLLEQQHPDLVVSGMSKALRTGKVFIDWSQNAEHKTTICVYSLRAKERPFVSMPLTWQEVQQSLKRADPDMLFFETEEALKRVTKFGDLFEPVLKLKQKLPLSFPSPEPARKAVQGDHSIRAYRAKRDFHQTEEPAPSPKKKKSTKSKEPLFVIQKHVARRLHYDFRLEMEGVLRSWAVPNGIPTQIGDRRLAVHVEDHPMEYARFEGTIPKGNYGAGTVMVWDIGTYEVIEENAVEAYRKGKISMLLKGAKLKGEWTLVKTKTKDSEANSWLLLKKSENMAPISPRQDDRSVLSGRTMKKIADDNDAQWISSRSS